MRERIVVLIGHSNQRGIMFADRSVQGDNAVYCWYEGEEMRCCVGRAERVRERFVNDQKADRVPQEKDRHGALMLRLAAIALAAIAVTVIFLDNGPLTVAVSLVAIVGWFPAYAILSTGLHEYESDEVFEQFKRFHGAEHAAVACYRKSERGWTMNDLRSASWLEQECGTVYMATVLVWLLIVAVAILNVASLGVLKLVGVIFGSLILLALNTWFNPANPLKRVQLRVVSKPGDRELALASAALRKFQEVTGA